MEIAYLGIVFLVIIALLGFRRPLYQAILGGLVAIAILFRMPPAEWVAQTAKVFTTWSSLSVLLSFYLISYLQRMLEARSQIKLAQQDLNGLFHNRRINAAGSSLFIGLLPSAAAMLLCGSIVKDATDGYLKPKEQAFVASWFRHIPESTLPTYSGVLLMSTLSGIPLATFMPGMIVPIIVLISLGYFLYLRKLPKDPGTPASSHRGLDALHLIQHSWTLLLILALILIGKMQVVTAILAVLALAVPVYGFRWADLRRMTRTAFEPKLLVNMFLVLVLKEFITHSGALALLPEALSVLPIPMYLIFALMFFVGGIISGSSGIIAMGTPLAFAAIPDGGMPLMVLLMCMSHAASQLSPTHICLVVAADYFKITMGELIRKTLPVSLLFGALMVGYYMILTGLS